MSHSSSSPHSPPGALRSRLGSTLLTTGLALGALAAPSQQPTADRPLVRDALREAVRSSQQRLGRTLDLHEDHSAWTNPFRVKTEHYDVRSIYSGRLTLEVAQGLEAMRPWFGSVLGAPPRKDQMGSTPQLVQIYPGLEAYNEVGNAYGTEDSSILGGFYATDAPGQPLAIMGNPNRVLVKMWATHVATLHYLSEGWSTAPPTWVSRGLASYFSLFWDFNWGAQSLKRFRDSGAYVPLPQLLREGLSAYPSAPEPRLTTLGVFFSYLLNYREDTRNRTGADGSTVLGPFAEYLRVILDGGDPRSHPLHELMTRNLERLEAEFLAYDFGK